MTYLRFDPSTLNPIKRMHEIRQAINDHNKNIRLLFEYATGLKNLKNKGYTRGAENYQRTLEDNDRFFTTIHNLRQQIIKLEKELRRLAARTR